MTLMLKPRVSGVRFSVVAKLSGVVRNTPSTVLSCIRIHCNTLAVHKDFSVFVLTTVHPEDDGHVITLTTIEEGEIVDVMSIRIGTNRVITSELNEPFTVTQCTLGRSSFSSYTNSGQSNESRKSE